MKPNREYMIDKLDEFIERVSLLKRFFQYTGIRDNREKFAKLRTIYINNVDPNIEEYNGDKPLKYSNNDMITSKYTFWNFLPKNLFEQFRRIANFYFLVNILILFVIPDPPTSPYANALPLIIVISVTAIKQAYEDIIRHRADREINHKTIRVLRDSRFVSIKWKDIKCGDIVEVLVDHDFPCDLLLLHAKTDTGVCYIKTANLDGETNLKMRVPPNKFPAINTIDDLDNLRGIINCDKPNARLYEFKGAIITENNKQYALSNENILLRGTTLKIAPVIYGCAIYTGRDTKMMINSKFKSNKLSCVEKRLNYFVASFVVLLVLLSLFCLFELTRFIGSQFFEWDLEMYDHETDQPAKVNSSDLNEDLGQIEYLFSDKTGTLTENEMIFKRFGLEGKIYEENKGTLCQIGSDKPESITNEKFKRFIEALSLCHTVQLDMSNEQKYNASSPDELSFILFCSKIGVVYNGDTILKTSNKNIRSVIYKATNDVTEKNYEIKHILEFDSTRKRMSVILKDLESNQYVLYSKGADTAIFKKSIDKKEELYENCLKTFSENGWRTLVLAYRLLSESEFEKYDNLINEANQSVLNRDELLKNAYEAIETDLQVIGVTAVEDKLQEDVENTLLVLRQAGIKIWVLTGDKLETAINISDSCKHFSKTMIKFVLKNITIESDLKENLNVVQQQLDIHDNQSFALVIDGDTLTSVFEYKFQEGFKKIAMRCDAVLCCRMSPAQKAEIVKLVKLSSNSPMTAAIGDGANDVSMIQEAHVGLGIFGKEGRIAARSADFSFAKFKYLKRVFLVHGYLFYTRASCLVLYFFYKNFVFAICQAYYAYWNAFSCGSLYTSIYLSFYNLALTTAPIFILSLFEQRKPIDQLEANPFHYRTIRRNKCLSWFEFIKWIGLGVWHSAVSFFIPLLFYLFESAHIPGGKSGGGSHFGGLVLFLIIIVTHAKILLIWNHLDALAFISFILSAIGFVVVCLISNGFILPFPLTVFTEGQSIYYNYFVIFSSASIWFVILLCTVIAIIPDLAIAVYENIKERNLFTRLTKNMMLKENKSNITSEMDFSAAFSTEQQSSYAQSLIDSSFSDQNLLKKANLSYMPNYLNVTPRDGSSKIEDFNTSKSFNNSHNMFFTRSSSSIKTAL